MSHSPTRSLVAKAFSNAAASYVENAALQVQVGEWLLQGLSPASRCLDVGCGAGYMAKQLAARELVERVVGLDCAWEMLRQQTDDQALVCADMAAPPFAQESFDQLTSNLALQWVSKPVQVLSALLPLLKVGGSCHFSVPAPGSLTELSCSWESAGDSHQHINQFNSAEEWRDFSLSALQKSGMQGVVDIQQREFVRWFESPRAAIQSLRNVGANRVTAGARQGLTGKSQYKAMLRAYESQRQEQGIAMTYQVLKVKIVL